MTFITRFRATQDSNLRASSSKKLKKLFIELKKTHLNISNIKYCLSEEINNWLDFGFF